MSPSERSSRSSATRTDIESTEASVLQPGTKQVAAGYVLYGSSTVLVYTAGDGVHMFTLDPQIGTFLLTRENIQMPQQNNIYSVNEAYLHSFPEPYQRYLHWAKHPGGGHYSSRYVGSLVADFHRILIKGGVFLYPPTATHPDGKLRLMYEANPLAFVAEQAGGMATDGARRIVEMMPQGVHDRTPLIIGSTGNVGEAMRFVNDPVRANVSREPHRHRQLRTGSWRSSRVSHLVFDPTAALWAVADFNPLWALACPAGNSRRCS